MTWLLIVVLMAGTPIEYHPDPVGEYPSKQECLLAAAKIAHDFEKIGGVTAFCRAKDKTND